MIRPTIERSSIDSDGPKHYPQPDGSTYVKATPCPVCGGTIEAGEQITKLGTTDTRSQWAHKPCAQKEFDAASIRNAWALLGADAARRPRAYRAKDLTTILEHLVQLVYRDEFDEEDDDRADVAATIVNGRRADGTYTPEATEAMIRLAAEGGDWPA